MVHLSKLAVGIRDMDHLRLAQAGRAAIEGVLRHRTRMAPRRVDDLIGGGSIYWVIAGTMLARQRVTDVQPALREDGAACVALMLDPTLVPVLPRAVRAFQGWRYLEPEDAPLDLAGLTAVRGEQDLPATLRATLRALALL